jgi:PKD repeat protein
MKRLITGMILVFLLLGTVACASPESMPSVVPAPAPEGNEDFGIPAPAAPSGGIAVPEVTPTPTPAPAPAPLPTMPIEEDAGESWATERMIVRTGNMRLVVANVDDAIEEISGIAKNYEGYVVSSSSWREGDRLVGTITIRVLADNFDDAIRALRRLASEVSSESTSSQDVTEEYVDLSARLHNLEATKVQLEKLLEKTEEKVTDILEVQRELSQVTGEIEQTKGRMQYLERTSSTSLIEAHLEQEELDVRFTASTRSVKTGQNIRFDPSVGGGFTPYSYEWDFGDGSTSTEERPTHAYQAEGRYTVLLKVTDDRGNTAEEKKDNYIDVLPGWNAGSTASSAWTGLSAFGRFLADFFIWLGYFSPLWIVIGVILYFAWWRRRKKA